MECNVSNTYGKVAFFIDTCLISLEQTVNNFIKDKNVIDIQYQAVQIAKPPYVSDRVMIIYEEET